MKEELELFHLPNYSNNGEIHPLKDKHQFPLWISQATNYMNDALGLRGAQKIIEEALLKAKLDKHKRLYLLRHSRATHLCMKLYTNILQLSFILK